MSDSNNAEIATNWNFTKFDEYKEYCKLYYDNWVLTKRLIKAVKDNLMVGFSYYHNIFVAWSYWENWN